MHHQDFPLFTAATTPSCVIVLEQHRLLERCPTSKDLSETPCSAVYKSLTFGLVHPRTQATSTSTRGPQRCGPAVLHWQHVEQTNQRKDFTRCGIGFPEPLRHRPWSSFWIVSPLGGALPCAQYP